MMLLSNGKKKKSMRRDRIDIIYEDKFIIVVNKPSNLLTIATDNEKEKTLFHKVISYEKQKNKNNKVFIVHRLDKDTSGLIVFAKSERVKKLLQDNWDRMAKTRGYVAVVEGKVVKKEGTIKNWIKERTNFTSYTSNKPNDGKLAITKYSVLNVSKSYSLLNIKILTGRKNQIRVHMNDIGHPIIGDKKYGAKTNPLKRLGLHANILELEHPITHKLITFECTIPMQFQNMFESVDSTNKKDMQ
ncbi:MAG: RNA pseudouridine synthase [Firmicutes bacterium]|nr:RNA pseudouridine synthase [Bacillota bacterium]